LRRIFGMGDLPGEERSPPTRLVLAASVLSARVKIFYRETTPSGFWIIQQGPSPRGL